MDQIEFAYTRGMTVEEVEDRLSTVGHGSLALCRDGEAYAIPMAHHYDGERLYFRFGNTPDSKKRAFLETTETATYLMYDAEPTDEHQELDSWSVHVTGQLRERSESATDLFDEATINEWFAPFRVFDENVDEIEWVIVELIPEAMHGRITTG